MHIEAVPTNCLLSTNGFCLLPRAIPAATLAELQLAFKAFAGAGDRINIAHPLVRQVAEAEWLQHLLQPHFMAPPFVVRAIAFDKSPQANWSVTWHQDLTIAIAERRDVPDFGPWSRKAGIPHVQPPTALLERMLTARLHLDDAPVDNGALRVLSGSHLGGRWSAEEIESLRESGSEFVCAARAGDVLLMRPLLLHASSRAENPRRRRVLHLEFADQRLPMGLEWGGWQATIERTGLHQPATSS